MFDFKKVRIYQYNQLSFLSSFYKANILDMDNIMFLISRESNSREKNYAIEAKPLVVFTLNDNFKWDTKAISSCSSLHTYKESQR